MRLLGAAGGVVCLYGLAIVLQRRAHAAKIPWRKSSFADWFFPLLLAITVLTGLVTEIAVYAPIGSFGHAIFFAHVVLAMDLVALLPFTKFAHVLYRALALVLFAWRHSPAPDAVTAGAQA
jgi:nitrate reductase gamma subunit